MRGIDLKRAMDERAKGDDWFTILLLRLIMKADVTNRDKLAVSYPVEVAACHIFRYGCLYLNEQKTHVDFDGVVKTAVEKVSEEKTKS